MSPGGREPATSRGSLPPLSSLHDPCATLGGEPVNPYDVVRVLVLMLDDALDRDDGLARDALLVCLGALSQLWGRTSPQISMDVDPIALLDAAENFVEEATAESWLAGDDDGAKRMADLRWRLFERERA